MNHNSHGRAGQRSYCSHAATTVERAFDLQVQPFLFRKPKIRQFIEDGQSAVIFMCFCQLEKNSTINENVGKNMWTSVVLEFQLLVCTVLPIQSLRPFLTDFQTRFFPCLRQLVPIKSSCIQSFISYITFCSILFL